MVDAINFENLAGIFKIPPPVLQFSILCLDYRSLVAEKDDKEAMDRGILDGREMDATVEVAGEGVAGWI